MVVGKVVILLKIVWENLKWWSGVVIIRVLFILMVNVEGIIVRIE